MALLPCLMTIPMAYPFALVSISKGYCKLGIPISNVLLIFIPLLLFSLMKFILICGDYVKWSNNCRK